MLRNAVVMLLLAAPVAAQVQSRPTDPPLVTAAGESWFQLREPIQYAGDLYYPAGSLVFFDGNKMARVGHYNGVPLYADATIEPYSVVLVPVRRGLMQPYERLRRGDLAGTTGSRAPSFTSALVPYSQTFQTTPVAPTQLQQAIGAISAYSTAAATASRDPYRREPSATTAPVAMVDRSLASADRDVSASTAAIRRPQDTAPLVSARPPENNDGLWVRFKGQKWVSAGPAIPLNAELNRVGEYGGFPVFGRESSSDRIYLPTRPGFVAPYKLK